ncbi:MAG: O-antigen ligase family protein [Lachnospiraceae bacterium]|nr:O-antigen ligase family protein [Lachnospiraceae bacterium]
MSLKLNISKLYIYLTLLIFLPPGCLQYIQNMEFLNKTLAMLRYLWTAWAILDYILNKERKRKFSNLFLAGITTLSFLMILSMKMNGTIYFTGALSCVNNIGWILVNMKLYDKDREKLFTCYLHLLCSYFILNFLVQIIFSQGLVKNHIGDNRVFFIGLKNSMTTYSILFLFLYVIMAADKKQKKHFIGVFLLLDIAILVNGSSATLLTAVIIQAYLLFEYILGQNSAAKKMLIHALQIFGVAAVIFFFYYVVVGNQNFIFTNLISMTFGKGISFSGRGSVWQLAVSYIMKYPVWGQGNDVAYVPWGNGAIVYSAHNAYLDFAVKYGLLVGVFYVCFLLWVIKRAISASRDSKKLNIPIFVITVSIAFMFEASAGFYTSWAVLLFTYLLSKSQTGERIEENAVNKKSGKKIIQNV